MRLVRPPLVRMDVTTSSLSSKAFSCSSVVRCSLLSGSNSESTAESLGKQKNRCCKTDKEQSLHSKSQYTVYSQFLSPTHHRPMCTGRSHVCSECLGDASLCWDPGQCSETASGRGGVWLRPPRAAVRLPCETRCPWSCT